MGGALFWVGGGGWENTFIGGEFGWVHCLIMPKFNAFLRDVSLLLRLCFDSDEMRLGST